ncbi:DUF6193 family natural product biosynthesis protein [Streptomyces sp. NPDC041068]|uniref:DUF6193 family natural product biosynthesis protein n=1 Tax=Streptomyces sp. NPDC041068 TaxID=3155130 RepID=UPI0033EEEA5C
MGAWDGQMGRVLPLAPGPGQDDVVEAAWQRLLHEEQMDIKLVEAAYAEPFLRPLHPSTSHQSLHFSRCTGDWSWDVPFVMHLPGGRYLVAGPSRFQAVEDMGASSTSALSEARPPSGLAGGQSGTAQEARVILVGLWARISTRPWHGTA